GPDRCGRLPESQPDSRIPISRASQRQGPAHLWGCVEGFVGRVLRLYAEVVRHPWFCFRSPCWALELCGSWHSALGDIVNQTKYPAGWDGARVKQVLARYEPQSDDEAVAEDEAAYESTTHTAIEVPIDLVPAVRGILAK